MTTLKDFVQGEIDKRKFTAAEFARATGLGKQTINNILNEEGGFPRIQTLTAIAEYTGVSVVTLFSLVVGVDTTSAEAYILAQRIMELPPEKQKILMEFLTSPALNQANSGG